jgi:uncharacterized protein (DUF2342 family)
MTMMKMKAAKKVAPAAAAARRRCHLLAARPGTCVFILARQMSRSAACPAPRRKKRSEQTIYDAATREVLQIDFPSREEAGAAEKKQIPRAKFALGMTVRAFVRSLSNESVKSMSSGMNGCKKVPAEIIFGGTGWKFLLRLKGILVLRVRPSCRKRSSSSPAAPDFHMG